MAIVTPIDTSVVQFEDELEETRSEIRIALRERKHLPTQIVEMQRYLDDIRPDTEFQIKRLRASAERHRNLAADVAEIETSLASPYSLERAAMRRRHLEQASMADEQADLLQEEIELVELQLAELKAEESQVELDLDFLVEYRDRLIEQRDTIVAK
jgi:chromosome segregation ATPase